MKGITKFKQEIFLPSIFIYDKPFGTECFVYVEWNISHLTCGNMYTNLNTDFWTILYFKVQETCNVLWLYILYIFKSNISFVCRFLYYVLSGRNRVSWLYGRFTVR